jgi:uncharacterized protein YigA (DUF484 family)
MSGTALTERNLRDKIIADPNVILEDHDLMRALIAANEKRLGANIVDLRGVAMERLEARLERLEDTHRSVIAAAYDNLAGTNQVHRAVLSMLEPTDFATFLTNLATGVAGILRVDCIKLVLETKGDGSDSALSKLNEVLIVEKPGFIDDYIARGRSGTPRDVTLRQAVPEDSILYGTESDWVQSEALLKLNLGEGRLPGLLAMGSEDPHQFAPIQGTDLLTFFAGTCERAMRRWLS